MSSQAAPLHDAQAAISMVSPAARLAQQPALARALVAKASEVIRGGQYVLGDEVAAFEQECAAFLATPHALGVSNGSDALLLGLAALDIGAGDEVLVPTYTFVASAGSIARLGATPRFVDICPGCMTLLPADAKARIHALTRAVMPVHLFGQLAAMPALTALAATHRLAVVEDAAQSFAAPPQVSAAPTPAQAAAALTPAHCPPGSAPLTAAPLSPQFSPPQAQPSAFSPPRLWATSFFPSKNLGGCGDAGLITCSDEALAHKLHGLRAHGSYTRYLHHALSGNFRIDALQAALLRLKLPGTPAAVARRRLNAAHYAACFAELLPQSARVPAPCCCDATSHAQAVQSLRAWAKGRPAHAIALPNVAARHSPMHHTYNQYVVRFADARVRARVQAALAAEKIACAIYYPTPLHLQPCFAQHGMRRGDFPIAEHAAATSLALPIAEHLKEDEVARVARAVVRAARAP